jgi:hypothetical protein
MQIFWIADHHFLNIREINLSFDHCKLFGNRFCIEDAKEFIDFTYVMIKNLEEFEIFHLLS